MLELPELRGLTSYALTHIKQDRKEIFHRHLFFFSLACCMVSQAWLSAIFLSQTWLVVLTEIAFLPHYQMLNQCTGGHHQLPST